MVSWPEPGTRVTVRYRRPAGSVPPLTDAVGHLLAIDPAVRVRTKTGAIVEFAPADAVALRVLTDTPVRTSEIRALEFAAAAAWPGVEQTWLDGWLLLAGQDTAIAANSALPLDVTARIDTIPAIVAWYTQRGRTPRLAIPDRLLSPPADMSSTREERMLVRDVSAAEPDPSVALSAQPLAGGELVLGTHPRGAAARATVTSAPDGTRWVGLAAVRVVDDAPAVARLCEALLAWGARRGATRGYLREHQAAMLSETLGFRLHHRIRYFPATAPEDAPDNL
jgi:N-acetylglutamate synthase